MLNEDFILKRMEPYFNSKRELSEFEFSQLFSNLDLHEQYEVITIMIAHNIDYVDTKEETTAKLGAAPVLKQPDVVSMSSYMLRLTNEQLCVMAQDGNKGAVAALLEKNKKFVYSLALKLSSQFIKTNLSVEDLFQEGNIGLIEAIYHFDSSRDNSFITYSWHWIRQKISRAAIDTGYLIRLPVHKFDQITKLYSCRKKHPEASTVDLAIIMSADGTTIEKEKIEELIIISENYLNTTSLNTLVGESEDSELQDFVPDDSATLVEDEIIEKQLHWDIERALESLTPREERVLRLRFGLEDGRERTLEEVGRIFNVTRERIRQIEAKAIRKLRHPKRSKNLRSYL